MVGRELQDPLLQKETDIEEIKSCSQFFKESVKENKKLWYLAAPAIFTIIAQYSLGATTQVFAGHLTTLELDAFSTENMVIAGLAYGIMYGMGSALETLCGQAYGANQLHMMGVYLQRSWVILTTMAFALLPIYFFATPIMRFFGQDREIAELAGTFSLYMIPQLFAYAINFPMQKFLQAQSKVMAMAWVSGLALVFHIFLCWLLIVQFKLGLVGAATALSISWWMVDLGQFIYIVMGYCPGSWTGFSWGAFHDLGAFARLSIGSAIMLCLEIWYYVLLVVFAGNLKDAQIAVAAISVWYSSWIACYFSLGVTATLITIHGIIVLICSFFHGSTNLNGWVVMIFLGFNAAISVRISNELGAGRPRAAKFSILVVVLTATLIGVMFFILILVSRNVYALPFTNSPEVARTVSHFAVIFAFTLLFNSVQPVLTGVAVGAGWQWLIAYINIGCYYMVGLPLGFFLASKLDLGVEGIWAGMIPGVGLQTMIIIGIIFGTNWNKEAESAESRIRKWGGSVEPLKDSKSYSNGTVLA